MLRIIAIALALTTAAVAQKPGAESKPADGKDLEVSVPSYGNATCPIMSKPVKADLFVETPHGRVWVCCKTCLAKVKKDPDAIYAKTYPTVTKVNNANDPISGKPVKEGTTVVYQGYEIGLENASHAKAVLANGDVWVTLLTKPHVQDVKNAKDPVTNEPVADNMAVLIGDSLVHLSSMDSVEAVRKDPAKALEKARKSAKPDKKGD
jgi:hypothetical protein